MYYSKFRAQGMIGMGQRSEDTQGEPAIKGTANP